MSKLAGGTFFGLGLTCMIGLIAGCSSVPPEKEHFGRAHIYHMDGRVVPAELEYREVIAIRESPEVWFNLGLLAERRGDLAQAKENYERAVGSYENVLRGDEKRAEALMALGALAFRQRDFSLALGYFEQAKQTFFNNHLNHFNIGVTLEALGREDDALKAYTDAIELYPQFGDAHLALAFIYEAQGRIETARDHYSTARQHGVADKLLTDRLDWWKWVKEDRSAVVRVGNTRRVGNFSVWLPQPPEWRIGTAAQAGTTIVRTFPDTAATVIGNHSAVQIVGPIPDVVFGRRGTQAPGNYAREQLFNLMAARDKLALGDLADVLSAFAAGEAGAGDEERGMGDGDPFGEGDDEAIPQPWRIVEGMQVISFRNGATGARVKTVYSDENGSRFVNIHLYLGEQNSYVIVTTQTDLTGEANTTGLDHPMATAEANREQRKIAHALDYFTRHFEEVRQSTP